MVIEHIIQIPARVNAPSTTLYVKIETENAAYLNTRPYVFVLPGGPGANHSHYKDYGCLQSVCNVVFYDPRGCGLSSDSHPESFTMENYIDDLEAIRRFLNLKNVMLLGKSYGAMCALGYAIKYPENLNKLILAGGAPSHHFIDTARKNLALRQATREQVEGCEKFWRGELESNAEMAGIATSMGAFYSYKIRHGEPVNRPKPDYPSAYMPSNIGFKGTFSTFDYTAQLPSVSCETLILIGEEDWIADKCYSELMASQIPGATLIIFPKSDHSMESDVPENYFAAIQSFVGNKLKKAIKIYDGVATLFDQPKQGHLVVADSLPAQLTQSI